MRLIDSGHRVDKTDTIREDIRLFAHQYITVIGIFLTALFTIVTVFAGTYIKDTHSVVTARYPELTTVQNKIVALRKNQSRGESLPEDGVYSERTRELIIEYRAEISAIQRKIRMETWREMVSSPSISVALNSALIFLLIAIQLLTSITYALQKRRADYHLKSVLLGEDVRDVANRQLTVMALSAFLILLASFSFVLFLTVVYQTSITVKTLGFSDGSAVPVLLFHVIVLALYPFTVQHAYRYCKWSHAMSRTMDLLSAATVLRVPTIRNDLARLCVDHILPSTIDRDRIAGRLVSEVLSAAQVGEREKEARRLIKMPWIMRRLAMQYLVTEEQKGLVYQEWVERKKWLLISIVACTMGLIAIWFLSPASSLAKVAVP